MSAELERKANPVPRPAYRAFRRLFWLERAFGRVRVERYFPGRRARTLETLRRSMAERPAGRLRELPERRDLPLAAFRRDFVRAGVPVKLVGAARDWPCQRWDLDFFAERYGDEPALIMGLPGLTDPALGAPGEWTLPLRRYIDGLRAGDPHYLKNSPLVNERPELQRDLDLDWIHAHAGSPRLLCNFQFFMGARGSLTPMHAALPSNLFVQIEGRKRWRFFPTLAYPCLDPPGNAGRYYFSKFDPYDPEPPDDQLFPGLATVDCYETVTEPGDVLWIPPFVWHYPRNESDNIALAYRFCSPFDPWRMSVTLTLFNLLPQAPPMDGDAMPA